jgi:hypothetical protein
VQIVAAPLPHLRRCYGRGNEAFRNDLLEIMTAEGRIGDKKERILQRILSEQQHIMESVPMEEICFILVCIYIVLLYSALFFLLLPLTPLLVLLWVVMYIARDLGII